MIVNTLPARQAALPSVAKCKLRTPVTRVLCFKGPQMTPPVGPPRHSVGGPTGGLVDKIKELGQRLKDTPGDTLQDRINTWYDRRVSEHAADATGVTWPSTRITRLWKFFFKAGQGTTDRFGFAIKLAPVDQRTEEQRAAARAKAAQNVVNIDSDERSRRAKGGAALLVSGDDRVLHHDDYYHGHHHYLHQHDQ
eukprot:jgi/Chrzof1/11598/Cz06g01180.t1